MFRILPVGKNNKHCLKEILFLERIPSTPIAVVVWYAPGPKVRTHNDFFLAKKLLLHSLLLLFYSRLVSLLGLPWLPHPWLTSCCCLLAVSASIVFCFQRARRKTVTPGPLHMLFPLPGMPLYFSTWLPVSSSSHCPDVSFSMTLSWLSYLKWKQPLPPTPLLPTPLPCLLNFYLKLLPLL